LALDLRQSAALELLPGDALYRIDATQVEAEVASPDAATGLALARKATPSYYWGLRYRSVGPAAEAEYAYKILDKFVLGVSLGYHRWHPGFLVKTEWYEVGVAVDEAHVKTAHASYFTAPEVTFSLIAQRVDATTSVRGVVQLPYVELAGARNFARATATYAVDRSWRPGVAAEWSAERWHGIASVAWTEP
jgi:hypothetical protein